jgi:hypothetical protein
MFGPGGPAFTYVLSKAIDGFRGEGTYNVIALRVRKFYSYRIPELFYEPLHEYEALRQLSSFGSLLYAGGAPSWAGPHAAIGFRAFRSIYAAPGGVLPMPAPQETEVGDHSVAFLQWDPATDLLCFVNSWGREWGDGGLGYMSEEYFTKHAHDVW